MKQIGGQAVVLGAGMAGLLAARVLADAYQRVTVVERDPLPQMSREPEGRPPGPPCSSAGATRGADPRRAVSGTAR